jgi:hypothetical protein
MSGTQQDDPVLERVRAARPGSPAHGAGLPPDARKLLEAIVAEPRGGRRRGTRRGFARRRLTGWVAPALGAAVTLGVAAVAILVLGHRVEPTSSARPSGTRLTAAQYAIALGADSVTSSSAGTTRARLLFDAEQLLRQQCMRQRGVTYRIEPFPQPGPLPSITGYPSTFYPAPTPSSYPESTLLTVRAASGFGLYEDATGAHRDPDPEDAYIRTLSPRDRSRWLAAWRGTHGCLSLASAQLYGSAHAASVVQLLPSLVYDYLDSTVYSASGAISPHNQRTAAATTAWSRCMRHATGRTFSDEDALMTWLLNSDSPRQQRTTAFRLRETHYAVLDTRCAYLVGQPQAFTAAFRAAANHLPPGIKAQLQYLLDHEPQWVRRAREILKGHRP